MEWLKALKDYADSGRRKFDERMSKIEGLPRGQYLKQKYKLTDDPAVAIYKSTSPAAPAPEIDRIGSIPNELKMLLEWSDGLWDSGIYRKALDIQLFGVKSIQEYQRLAREVVDRDNLFPPVFKKFLFFGSDGAHRVLAVWEDQSLELSPVLLVDMEGRNLFLVSYSLELFFSRIVFAIDHSIQFRIGTRSKKLLTHITESEPGPTYPPKVKGQTQFFFDDINGFPDSWQPLLSEKDRSFELS
ncbi:MAG: hypothetical protein AAF578_01375 [Pseudomonadota bacterium]